jgi:hypothetical protein
MVKKSETSENYKFEHGVHEVEKKKVIPSRWY